MRSTGSHATGGRVLVVDDDADLATQIARVLTRAGFEATPVTQPVTAIDTLERFDPHIALVDLHLGDLDGHELGPALREHSRRPLQLVALTADDHPRTLARSSALGFAAHLVKPVPLRDLLRVVRVLYIQAVPSEVA